MINQLINIIGKEASVFDSFLLLLEEQQQMLLANNVDGLNLITDRQRELLVKSQLLTKKRDGLVEVIKKEMALDGNLDVARLISLVEKSQADRLNQLRTLILSLNNKINETRSQNNILINRSRKYINKTIAMLSKINTPESVYSRQGHQTPQPGNLSVDRSA